MFEGKYTTDSPGGAKVEETDRLAQSTGYVLGPPNREMKALSAVSTSVSRNNSQSKTPAIKPTPASSAHSSQQSRDTRHSNRLYSLGYTPCRKAQSMIPNALHVRMHVHTHACTHFAAILCSVLSHTTYLGLYLDSCLCVKQRCYDGISGTTAHASATTRLLRRACLQKAVCPNGLHLDAALLPYLYRVTFAAV